MYDRIKELCDKEKISISRLEKEVGLSNGVIGKWRTSVPGADVLLAVAERLGTTVEYLVRGDTAAQPEEKK